MGYDDAKRYMQESLMGFYEDQGQHFWVIFDQTPRAAAAAFKARPEIFGTLAKPYKDWPKMRAREHARLIDRLEILLDQAHPDAVRDREIAEADAPA